MRTLWFIPEELLGFVRGQLGWEAGTALKKRLAGLKEQDDEDLRERLHDEGMTDAERVVKEARDVLDRLKPQTAVLALDAGERLQPEDVELLGDLAEGLPEDLRIWIAVSTDTPADIPKYPAIVGRLRELGPRYMDEIPLHGIDDDGVGEWLEAKGLSRDKAAELTRATDGYALSLDAEIANLSPGEAIDDLPRDQKFARRTDDAWNRLAPELRHHARRLCVLADPLPSDRTPEFLGIDATEWGEAQELLREARIFSVEVNGLPWFHEKRRHYLIETKLDASERSALRREAWRWFDRELFAVLEGSSYGALYALEQRDWQPLLFEWIHLMTFLDPHEAAMGLARMYLKALWWWGCYLPFDRCDELVELGARVVELGDSAATELDRVVGAIERLHRSFSREGLRFLAGGEEPTGERESWEEARAALREIADGTAVGGVALCEGASSVSGSPAGESGSGRLPAARQVTMLVNVFLAHCIRGSAGPAGMGEEALEELSGLYETAISMAVDDDDAWDRAWFEYELADALADRAASGRTADAAAREGWRQRARELLAGAHAYVDDCGRDSVDDLDFELAANVERVEADLAWGEGRRLNAVELHARAVHYAHAFQVWPDSGPDLYTATFYREQQYRLAKRIAELATADEGRTDAHEALLAIDRVAAFRGEEQHALRDGDTGFLSSPDDLARRLGDHRPSLKKLADGPDDLADGSKERYSREAVRQIRQVEGIEKRSRGLVTLPRRTDLEDGR